MADRTEEIRERLQILIESAKDFIHPAPLYWYTEHVPILLERISELDTEGTAKEFASRHSPSDVCNADVEWMLERISELEEENDRLRATLEKKAEHLAEVRRGGEW